MVEQRGIMGVAVFIAVSYFLPQKSPPLHNKPKTLNKQRGRTHDASEKVIFAAFFSSQCAWEVALLTLLSNQTLRDVMKLR